MTAPLTAMPAQALKGDALLPGDKSISHRALILGGMAEGQTRITNLLEADDVLRTGTAVRQLGAQVERDGDDYVVTGAPWSTPDRTIYCGNAGTGVRLLMGAAAGQGIACNFDGDESLRKRPMGRILDPLAEMGVVGEANDGKLPVRLTGNSRPTGITYRLPKPSAQIKTAVLLAGLGASGEVIIEEPELSRDHTERMLPRFGVALGIEELGEAGRRLTLAPGAKLTGAPVDVPGDPSSAAFPIAAALIVPGSELSLRNMMTNRHRVGFLSSLKAMGADVSLTNQRALGGEEVADVTVRATKLKAVHLTAEAAPAQIDEYPILAVLAAFAEGTSRFEGLEELTVKESDRLAATLAMLEVNGVTARAGDDWLEIDGGAGVVRGGGTVRTHHDHRMAMSALVMGLAAQEPVSIDDGGMIATSFPKFTEMMSGFGAKIVEMR